MTNDQDYDNNVELEKNKACLKARWIGNGADDRISILIRATHPQAVRDLAKEMFKIDAHGIRHWDYYPIKGQDDLLKDIK
jgi:hypothetical protein